MKAMTERQRRVVEGVGALSIVIGAGLVHIALAFLIAGAIMVLVANFGEAPAEEESSDE